MLPVFQAAVDVQQIHMNGMLQEMMNHNVHQLLINIISLAACHSAVASTLYDSQVSFCLKQAHTQALHDAQLLKLQITVEKAYGC